MEDKLATLLASFVVEQDIAGTQPLIHTGCGQRVCDVDPFDTLEVLVQVALDHVCQEVVE
jgi:hypothetical protein